MMKQGYHNRGATKHQMVAPLLRFLVFQICINLILLLKKLVAESVNFNSSHAEMPFLTDNSSALSESLLESEILDHMSKNHLPMQCVIEWGVLKRPKAAPYF